MNCELPKEYTYEDESVQIDGCGCAVVAVEDGRIIYDYNKLVMHFHECEDMKSLDDHEFEHETAIEWISYNVVRGIDYIDEGIRPDIREDGLSILDYDEEE